MNIVEMNLCGFELVVEYHKKTAPRWICWERPSSRDFILDIGKFSWLVSFIGYKDRTWVDWSRLFFGALLLGAAIWFTTNDNPASVGLDPLSGSEVNLTDTQ